MFIALANECAHVACTYEMRLNEFRYLSPVLFEKVAAGIQIAQAEVVTDGSDDVDEEAMFRKATRADKKDDGKKSSRADKKEDMKKIVAR